MKTALKLRRSCFMVQTYVFHATRDIYICSVSVNVQLLEKVFNTKYDIFVLLFRDVSSIYRSDLQALRAATVDEEPVSLPDDSTPLQCGCLLRLESVRLYKINRNINRI